MSKVYSLTLVIAAVYWQALCAGYLGRKVGSQGGGITSPGSLTAVSWQTSCRLYCLLRISRGQLWGEILAPGSLTAVSWQKVRGQLEGNTSPWVICGKSPLVDML